MTPATPDTNVAAAPTTRPSTAPSQTGAPQVQRQFVNFAFYKLDPSIRRLSADEKRAARDEFVAAANARPHGMMCLTYSTAGLKAETDFLLWRISQTPDDFQAHTAAMNRTRVGGYLS